MTFLRHPRIRRVNNFRVSESAAYSRKKVIPAASVKSSRCACNSS